MDINNNPNSPASPILFYGCLFLFVLFAGYYVFTNNIVIGKVEEGKIVCVGDEENYSGESFWYFKNKSENTVILNARGKVDIEFEFWIKSKWRKVGFIAVYESGYNLLKGNRYCEIGTDEGVKENIESTIKKLIENELRSMYLPKDGGFSFTINPYHVPALMGHYLVEAEVKYYKRKKRRK